MRCVLALVALAAFASACTHREPGPLAELEMEHKDAESRMTQESWEHVEWHQRLNRLANELQLSGAAKDQVAALEMARAQLGLEPGYVEISSRPKTKDRVVGADELDKALGKRP